MLASGTILQNRYRIIRPIGQGGMGAVYEAVDERLGHTVALKELLLSGQQLRKAFEHEARRLAPSKHQIQEIVYPHGHECPCYITAPHKWGLRNMYSSPIYGALLFSPPL